MIVADANLLIYLYVRSGALTDTADEVYRRDAEWAAPYLWRSEFRNALARMVRKKQITLTEARTVIADAETLLNPHEYLVASDDVLDLAVRSGCTAYDCEYVALAHALDVVMVTEDRDVLAAFPGRAVTPTEFRR